MSFCLPVFNAAVLVLSRNASPQERERRRRRGGGGALRDETIGLLAQFCTRELIPLEYISHTAFFHMGDDYCNGVGEGGGGG